jgi:trehalose 6-phosphate phosphatase
VAAAACALASQYPGLLVEEKYGALALHYRQRPELALLCTSTLARAVEQTAGLTLMEGKMVVEVKSTGVDKGTAIADFLAEAPFAGHLPLFAGDDTTDEAGFAVAQRAGGAGVKVGQGQSIAHHWISSPEALRMALAQVVDLATKEN